MSKRSPEKTPAVKHRSATIDSVEDLVVALEAAKEYYDGPTWYRGQSVAAWTLVPGYYRLTDQPPETTLIKRFKQSAAMLIDGSPNSLFDWLFLMQHYGVPTRLLDWSESPLVALYFAVESSSKHANEDAALWGMQPSELNKHAGIDDSNEEYFVPSFDDEELQNYSVEVLRGKTRKRGTRKRGQVQF